MNLFTSKLINSQSHLTTFFSQAIAQNRLSQAYFLVGSNTSDKLNLACELAMLLNCSNSNALTCGHCLKQAELDQSQLNYCRNCQWLKSLNHPKCLSVIKLNENETKIKVDRIRELNEDLTMTSSFYRVVFFENADSEVLHRPSGNCLLKTIEEPKVKVLFLLCSSQEFEILPTLKSRCQVCYINNPAQENLDYELNPKITEFINKMIKVNFKIHDREKLNFVKLLDDESKVVNFKLLHKQITDNQFKLFQNKFSYLNAFQDLVIKHLEYNNNYVNTMSSWQWFVKNWFIMAEKYLIIGK